MPPQLPQPSALTPLAPPPSIPAETDLISSLAQLQELHIALHTLRPLFPTLLTSLPSPSYPSPPPHPPANTSTPSSLYTTFSRAAIAGGRDIKSFSSVLGEPRFARIFAEARGRRGEIEGVDRDGMGVGVGVWRVEMHDDWLEVGGGDGSGEDGGGMRGEGGEEDVRGVVEGFVLGKDEGVEVAWEGEEGTVKVSLPKPANLRFSISTRDVSQGYRVEGVGKGKLLDQVVEAINKWESKGGLAELLEMLASYTDVRTRPCVKCSRLLDRNGRFPVVRAKKIWKTEEGQRGEWSALHSSCA